MSSGAGIIIPPSLGAVVEFSGSELDAKVGRERRSNPVADSGRKKRSSSECKRSDSHGVPRVLALASYTAFCRLLGEGDAPFKEVTNVIATSADHRAKGVNARSSGSILRGAQDSRNGHRRRSGVTSIAKIAPADHDTTYRDDGAENRQQPHHNVPGRAILQRDGLRSP